MWRYAQPIGTTVISATSYTTTSCAATDHAGSAPAYRVRPLFCQDLPPTAMECRWDRAAARGHACRLARARMQQETSVPRAQLYRELWAEPALVVAKRYGISDVGLAKVCRRYGIPKPGLGYWAQRQVGKAPAPPPLPPAQSADLETVFFHSSDQAGPKKEVPEYEREKNPEWLIRVPPDLALSHPLVKAAAAALHRAAKTSDSIPSLGGTLSRQSRESR